MKKIFFLIIIVIFLTGCNIKKYTRDYLYLDTKISITLYNVSKDKSNSVFDEIDQILNKYHKLTNRYEAYEGIVNIHYLNNNLQINEKISIDSSLSDVIRYGLELDTINIAIGNAVDIWKEHQENNKAIPSLSELSRSNNSKKDISLKGNIYLKRSNVKLDLGAYVKGYVTELIGNRLEEEKIDAYIINAGGNVKVGNHYDNSLYKIGVEDPTDVSKITEVINAKNISVVTSGGYERYYSLDGQKYSHILDNKTYYPVNNMISITIITKDSLLADTLSTSLYLMKVEDALDYVNNRDDVEVFIIDNNNQKYYSNGYSKYE